MVAYATVVYFVSLFALLFTYTICWDLYTGSFSMAIAMGGDSTILGYIHHP